VADAADRALDEARRAITVLSAARPQSWASAPTTVRSHVSAILRKLGVANREAAIKLLAQ